MNGPTDFAALLDQLLSAEVEFILIGGVAGNVQGAARATYDLLFIRRLDDLHTLEENKANRLKKPMERRVFPKGKDAAEESTGLGLFLQSLVGLDRAAAKAALGRFTHGRTLSANQIEFINLIVDHLTEHGVMAPDRLYESPFTDLTPRGPDGLFQSGDIEALFDIIESVRSTAAA